MNEEKKRELLAKIENAKDMEELTRAVVLKLEYLCEVS